MADCADFEVLMNAWMDGELSEADAAALNAHCAGCAACDEKMRATRMLRQCLSEMAPETDVPLKAQAAWRGAIQREAAAQRRRRVVRWVGAIAAAAVVALGGAWMLRPGAHPSMSAAPMRAAEPMLTTGRNVAVIEADGAQMEEAAFDAADDAKMEAEAFDAAGGVQTEMEEAMDAAMPLAQPMQEWRMSVADLDRTCHYISDLVSEYEGTLETQRPDAARANLYVDLPAENAEDFVKAAAHYDTGKGPGEISLPAEGRVSLLLVLTEAA